MQLSCLMALEHMQVMLWVTNIHNMFLLSERSAVALVVINTNCELSQLFDFVPDTHKFY